MDHLLSHTKRNPKSDQLHENVRNALPIDNLPMGCKTPLPKVHSNNKSTPKSTIKYTPVSSNEQYCNLSQIYQTPSKYQSPIANGTTMNYNSPAISTTSFQSCNTPTVNNCSKVSSNNPICRICFDVEKKEALITPCLCSGSMEYVHKSCLEKWLSTRNTGSCEVCHCRYHITKTPLPMINYLCSDDSKVRQTIASDFLCFILLTPLTLISVYLCTVGAVKYKGRFINNAHNNTYLYNNTQGWNLRDEYVESERWGTSGLIILAMVLGVIYLTWFSVALRFHIAMFKKWRRVHFIVRLLSVDHEYISSCSVCASIKDLHDRRISQLTQVSTNPQLRPAFRLESESSGSATTGRSIRSFSATYELDPGMIYDYLSNMSPNYRRILFSNTSRSLSIGSTLSRRSSVSLPGLPSVFSLSASMGAVPSERSTSTSITIEGVDPISNENSVTRL